MLSATLDTYSTLVAIHGEGVDIASMGFSTALCDYCEQMDSITTTAAMYEANRAEYMVKEKAKEKAQRLEEETNPSGRLVGLVRATTV